LHEDFWFVFDGFIVECVCMVLVEIIDLFDRIVFDGDSVGDLLLFVVIVDGIFGLMKWFVDVGCGFEGVAKKFLVYYNLVSEILEV